LAKALAMAGHEVVVIDPHANDSFVTKEGIKIIHIPNWNRGWRVIRIFWNRIPTLYKLFVKQKADYYYVRMRSYPSKLTEFLATGKSVVSVNVGKVSDYLTDGINAYLVQSGNVEELAEKLTHIYNNYDAAKVVGIKGQELVHSVFNYNYQAKRMIRFIQSLNN
jgi:Glycosyl transferases group 1